MTIARSIGLILILYVFVGTPIEQYIRAKRNDEKRIKIEKRDTIEQIILNIGAAILTVMAYCNFN